MLEKNGFYCYEGPPVFILSPEQIAEVRRLPHNGKDWVNVHLTMVDGKTFTTTIVGTMLADLPAPYVPSDIAAIRRYYTV